MDNINQQSDIDLATTGQMLLSALSAIHQVLVKRGVECDISHYSTGRMTVEYTRVKKEKIA
jgi:hypothetical protein